MKNKASRHSTDRISKDSSESAGPVQCNWCDHPSGYLPPVLDDGKWIHFKRDGDGQTCTAPTCGLCGHPWIFSYGNEGGPDGRCYFPVGPNASGGQRSCYCKCVFPVTQDTASASASQPTAERPYCLHCQGKGFIDAIEQACAWCNPGGEFRSAVTPRRYTQTTESSEASHKD